MKQLAIQDIEGNESGDEMGGEGRRKKKKSTRSKRVKEENSEPKLRPPRVYYDKDNAQFYIRYKGVKVPFEKGTKYKDAIKRSVKSIRMNTGLDRVKAKARRRMPYPTAGSKADQLIVSSTNSLPFTMYLQKLRDEMAQREADAKNAIDEVGADPLNEFTLAKKYIERNAAEDEKRAETKVKAEPISIDENSVDFKKKAQKHLEREFDKHIDSVVSKMRDRLKHSTSMTPEEEAKIAQEIVAQERHNLQMPELEEEQIGSGARAEQIKRDGLYSDQIADMMEEHVKHGFIGVVAADEFNLLVKPSLNFDKFGFIFNRDKASEPGSHWLACYVDTVKDNSVEYYDSYAEDPSPLFLEQIKKILDAHKLNIYLKFKVNKVKEQAENSPLCGFHAMKFLIDRFKGKPFAECSGYSDVRKQERIAGGMMKKFDRFGYI